MGKIKLLPKEVYSKIAAGEVIDGPYSVVRELIDNSVDAESKSIKIATKQGGKELIMVQDDGLGMSMEDAELAVRRHATSKISDIDDLECIETMGFRGEALSSICSVSDFELVTKSRDEDTGVKLMCKYGEVDRVELVPFPGGTRITARNIFGNLPARKKFLKSNRSENSRIKDVVVKKALCFNEIAFKYESEDKVLFALTSGQTREERIGSLFGQEIDNHLIELGYHEDNFSIEGFITDREYTLSNRNGQYIFINRRPIYNRTLQYIINEASKMFIIQARYPYAFIYLEIDPQLIDVNVHPAKLEVKIKNIKEISSALYHIIQAAYQKRIYLAKEQIGYEVETIKENRTLDGEKSYEGSQISLIAETGAKNEFYVKDKNVSASANPEIRNLDEDIFHLLPGIKETELKADEISSLNSDVNDIQLRYVGSIMNGFLIFESTQSIFLVDQHAAHERILYEKFAQKYNDVNPTVNLLIPINLNPPPGMYDEVMEYIEEFERAGLKMEPFGDGSFNIVSIPALLPEDKEARIILEFFNEYFDKQSFPESGSIKDRFLKYAACRMAIKEGDRIGAEEAFHLLESLLKCDVPYMCPHGRPTILRVGGDQIRKLFKRR